MNKELKYRTVKYYSHFFCKWAYALELEYEWKFLWWSGKKWKKVAGNSLTRHIPSDWEKLNIIENIKLNVGEEYNE